ncbi:MAG: tetratricopeptide repeat protein [Dongiaceae bacterium]
MTIFLRRTMFAAMALALATMLPAAAGFAAGTSSSSSSSSSSSGPSDYQKAVDLIDDEDYAEAIPLLEKVVAADSSNADAFNYLGYANRKLGKHSEALGYYQRALALKPDHLGANEYLGELYLEMKLLPEAEQRLAVLQKACGACEEYEDLKEEIDEYKANQPS